MQNNFPNEVYIIGGGSSIKGHEKEIREMIKGKFSIGLNYSYRHFDTTIQCYVDELFYKEEHENMKDLNLVVGKYYGGCEKIREDNTIFLNARSTYKRDIKGGIYKSSLVGIWATTLAIYLMKEGNLIWFGFDYGSMDKKSRIDKKIITHYYQGEINHRGIGKVSYYESYRRAHRDFGCYSDIKGINIYNVSPDSQIHDFPRIDYYLVKEKISKRKYNQKEIIKSIKEKLKRLEVKKR